MATFRIDGVKYNPANWSSLDATERAACNRFAAARERELNTIHVTAYKCEGGPFHGHPLELESGTGSTAQTCTAHMSVGAWCGRYELQGNRTAADRLVWVGNDGGQAVNTHAHTTDQKKAGADVTGRGFEQLRDLLAELAEDPAERAEPAPTEEKPGRMVARYTIGRTVYTIDATAEAADRLRARITKAKRWFSDKLLQAARAGQVPTVKPAEPAPVQASAPETTDETLPALAAAVAIAAAQAQAAETCATGCADTADQCAELVTCDGPELDETAAAVADTPAAGCDAIGATDTPAETAAADCTEAPETLAQASGYTQAPETLRADHLRAVETGNTQQASSKTGAWSAVMFRTADGRAGLAFTRTGQPVQLVDCATGGERMRALQAMAQAAEQAHRQQLAADTPAAPTTPAADCTQAPETLAPDCTEAPETPAGAGALSIRLERWEGLVDECGQPVTVASFAEADRVLLAWSETAPEHGGYNKCGFLITWPDGDTYEGRFDLVHHRRERPSLRDHISGQAEFWLGTGCPMHMGEQEYQGVISRATEETRAHWSAVLDLLRVHAAYFPRPQPVSCPDLRALVQHLSIKPEDLVGLGVTTYRPSEHNLQRGAITAAEVSEHYRKGHILAVITYEDGSAEHVDEDAFEDHNNSRHTRRRLNLTRHGAPYLAQLAAAAAARKAADSSAAERKAQAEQKARADLLEKFAHLEQGHGCVVAARNMRALLKAAFPGVKFSVVTEKYSGGNSIRVKWTDGPTEEAVQAIVCRFKYGRFDSMTDSYETDRSDPWTELFGGCYYLDVDRFASPELIARSLAEHFPDEATRPSVEDWKEQRGLFDWRNRNDHLAAEFRRHLASIDATPPAKAARGAKA